MQETKLVFKKLNYLHISEQMIEAWFMKHARDGVLHFVEVYAKVYKITV